MKNNSNEVEDNSRINVKNSNFHGNDNVHIGNKIHQEIHDNSVSYELNISDVRNIESLSKYLTGKFGDAKVGVVGLIGLLSGLITIFSSFNSLFNNIKIFSWIPSFSTNTGVTLLIIGMILLTLGSVLLNALRYKNETRCRKCNKDYAYKDYKNPEVREVETREGTRRNITFHKKCEFCGDEITKKVSKLIPYDEEGEEDEDY